MLWNLKKTSIKIKWQSQHDQKIFCKQVQTNIKYGFNDLISKQIISQFQWGLKISVKTALKF